MESSLERALHCARLQQVLSGEEPSHPLAEMDPWLQRRIEPSRGHDYGGRLHQASGSCCRAAWWDALWCTRTPASLFGSPCSCARQETGEGCCRGFTAWTTLPAGDSWPRRMGQGRSTGGGLTWRLPVGGGLGGQRGGVVAVQGQGWARPRADGLGIGGKFWSRPASALYCEVTVIDVTVHTPRVSSAGVCPSLAMDKAGVPFDEALHTSPAFL